MIFDILRKHDHHHHSTSSDHDHGDVETAGVKDTIIVEHCTVDDAWAVITDVERYPEFMTVYKKVEILSREVNEATQEQTLVVRYHIHTTFKNIIYTLRLHQKKKENEAYIQWDRVDGPALENKGGWILKNVQGGVSMEYDMFISFSMYVPHKIKQWVMEQLLHSSMDSMKKRIEQQKHIRSHQVQTRSD